MAAEATWDVCHSPSSLTAPRTRSHGKLRRRLTGTGVGSNFRFVVHLELKPAVRASAPSPLLRPSRFAFGGVGEVHAGVTQYH